MGLLLVGLQFMLVGLPNYCSEQYLVDWGLGWRRHCATRREVPGTIPGGITADFFRGNPDRTMCSEVDSASESEYQGFLLG